VLDVDTATPAVVLKLDPNVFHHGGLGVIRSLGRLGIPVYAVYEDRLSPAAQSKYLTGGWRWRPGAGDPDRLRQGLVRLADRIGRPAVLLPTDDAGALFLAEHGDGLRRWFRFPAPEPGLPRTLADKYALYRTCQRLGLPSAATVRAGSLAEAAAFADRAGFPVVVKLARPWRGGAVRSTSIVRTRGELAALYARSPGADLMVQEYLPAGGDWIVHGYCDARSACRPLFTGRKIRSYPAHAGLTSLGRAEPNEELAAQAQKLLDAVRYQGIMDLDLRFDTRDGSYKLLDFNPRLGAQFRLFADDAGVDVARAAHLDLTGRPIPAGTPLRRGFLVENYDPLAALGHWRRGELGARGWLASLRGIDELAWFAADDLAPFGLMCARMCWRAVRRPFGTRRRPAEPAPPRYRAGRHSRKAVHR
jgi:D-aspartate ligase